jgi:hypothetical protein
MTTPKTWDRAGLSSFLDNDSLAGDELVQKLLALGRTKHENLSLLVQDLLKSEQYLHHRYATLVATGAKDLDTLLKEVRHESTFVHERAASAVAKIASEQQLLELLNDKEIVPHAKRIIINTIKLCRRNLIQSIVPTVAKQNGVDNAIRILAYTPSSVSDEALVQQVEQLGVQRIVHFNPWVNRRSQALILFLRRLYEKLSANIEDKVLAAVALTWNQDVIFSILRKRDNLVASNMLDLCIEILYTPYKDRKTPPAELQLFTLNLAQHYNKYSAKLVKFLTQFLTSYGIESTFNAFFRPYQGSMIETLNASDLITIWDALWNALHNRTGRSSDGEVVVNKFLLDIPYERKQQEYTRYTFYRKCVEKYGKQFEDFIFENISADSTLDAIHPIVGNNIAQRRLEKVKSSKTITTMEESALLTYTNPFDNEEKRKHFEGLTSNSNPAERGANLKNYLLSAIYNNKNVAQVMEFMAKRLQNEPDEVKAAFLQVFQPISHYSMRRRRTDVLLLRNVIDAEALPSLEKILNDACFGSKSGQGGIFQAVSIAYSIASSYHALPKPRETLSFAVKMIELIGHLADQRVRRSVPHITSEILEAYEKYINDSIEKGKFDLVQTVYKMVIKPEKSEKVKAVLDRLFGEDGELKKILTDRERASKLSTSIYEGQDRFGLADLFDIYIKAEKDYKTKIEKLKRNLKIDPSLIFTKSAHRIAFSTRTGYADKNAILGPYFDMKQLDNKTLMSMAPKDTITLVLTTPREADIGSFNAELLLALSPHISLNADQRQKLTNLVESALTTLPTFMSLDNINALAFSYLPSRGYTLPHNLIFMFKRFAWLNGMLRVEKEEQDKLDRYLSTLTVKDSAVLFHAKASIIYTSTPAKALPKLLDYLSAENATVIAPATRRCAQFLPRDYFFDEITRNISRLIEHKVEEPAEQSRPERRHHEREEARRHHQREEEPVEEERRPERRHHEREEEPVEDERHENDDDLPEDDFEIIDKTELEGHDLPYPMGYNLRGMPPPMGAYSLRAPMQRPQQKKPSGISVQKEVVRSLHLLREDRTIRGKVYEFVCKLWHDKKATMHKDVRATVLYLAYGLLRTQRDEQEPELRTVLQEGIQDENKDTALSVFRNFGQYRYFANKENIKFAFTELHIKLLDHKDPAIRLEAIQGLSTAITTNENGLQVLLASPGSKQSPLDVIIDKTLEMALSFQQSQGHEMATSAISTLIHVSMLGNPSLIAEKLFLPLITEPQYKEIDKESNGSNWDLPLHARLNIICDNIAQNLWSEEDVQKRIDKRELIEKLLTMLSVDEILHWECMVKLRSSVVDLADSKSIQQDLIAPLVKSLLDSDSTAVYTSFVVSQMQVVLDQAKSANETFLNDTAALTAAREIIDTHNSSKKADTETKLFELLAYTLWNIAAKNSSEWTESMKEIILELRARKSNKELQLLCMQPKAASGNDRRGRGRGRGRYFF